MRLPLRCLVTAAAATALAVAGTMPASAADTATPLHVVRTIRGPWIAPLQFAASANYLYVADAAASALYRVGQKRPVALGPKPSQNQENSGSLDGVDVRGGQIAYVSTEANHRNTYFTVLQGGQQILRIDLGAYERANNPDGTITYGIENPAALTPACKATLTKQHVPISYTGEKDSHPYAVSSLADGSWLIADAGANDVLQVSPQGTISVVAVLPSQPTLITPALAKELKAPDCAGVTYDFESVPTDVEAGPNGYYVTTLPGGEGGVGSVYHLVDGTVTKIATGFPEATNVAVTPDGRIYVVELGRGVFQVVNGAPVEVVALPGAAAVEWANGKLWASTAPAVLGGKGFGTIVQLG